MKFFNFQDCLTTPIGLLAIGASDTAIHAIYFVDKPSAICQNALTQNAKKQLQEYFSGKRKKFDLPLAQAGTAFQQCVWQQLQQLRFGEQSSYGDIARAIGKPRAARAIGTANGRNAINIVVPCHRVVGANGQLGGYNCGLERKRWLLQHEALNY